MSSARDGLKLEVMSIEQTQVIKSAGPRHAEGRRLVFPWQKTFPAGRAVED